MTLSLGGRTIASVLIALIMCSTLVYAANIRSIETKPPTLSTSSTFSVIAEVGGTTCGLQMKFYLDDKIFSTKNIGCETTSVESDKWELSSDPLSCGIHTIKVELIDNKVVTQTKTKDISIGNVPVITINPNEPKPQAPTKIIFKDNSTGKPISDLQVEIYNKKLVQSSPKDYSTNKNGEIEFVSDTVGDFRLTIKDKNYCGSIDFRVRRALPYQGPIPENPVVGERIGVAVPAGVGVKYIDSEGRVFPLMNIGGGANFTIDKPGKYKLVMADIDTIFWKVEKNFTVSPRPTIEAELEPEDAVVNKVVAIRFTSRGQPVTDTAVKITKPIGGSEILETGSQGEIRFTPTAIGTYHYRIEKERYETLDGTFDAYNEFNVAITPYEPIANQDIVLNVTDQMGAKVENAIVYISDSSGVLVTESTGTTGFFKFRLVEPREYTIRIEKESFWDFEKKIRVYGLLALKLSETEIEVGDFIRISVTDKDNRDITAEVTAIRPDGRTDTIKNLTYVPQRVGNYTIKATKTGYKTVTQNLYVRPHPLDISARIDGRKVIVTATSHSQPVPEITILISTPTEEKQVVTSTDGIAMAAVDREGNLTISVNNISRNENYETKVIKRTILKQYSYPLLIIPITFVLICSIAAVGIIEYFHRYKEKAKREGGLFYKGWGSKGSSLQKGQKSSLSNK